MRGVPFAVSEDSQGEAAWRRPRPGRHNRRQQRPERLAAVADGVLLLGAQLGAAAVHARPAAARGRSRSRPRRAARAAASPPAGRTPRSRGPLPSGAGHGQSGGADERRSAVRIRNIGELGKQQVQVGGVVPVPPGPSGREDPRRAAQDVHGQARSRRRWPPGPSLPRRPGP